MTRKILERSGFSWGLRRSGELKLGLWRRKLERPVASRNVRPKRFVLTPGFGDSPISWLLVVSLLRPALKRAGFDEVVMLDFPGFNGKLAGEKCIPSMDLLLEAVGDVYDWLEPDTMLGHSLGGWLTARYAAEAGRGERPKHKRRHGYAGPRRVLLVAAAGVYESTQVRDAIAKIFGELIRLHGFSVLRPHLFAKEPFWFRWVMGSFAKFILDEGIHQFTQSFREEHLVQERLEDIRAETWLIWGDRDTLVPTSGMRTWLDGLVATDVPPRGVLIRGTGHSPQIEKPTVTAAVLTQILLGREPKGGRKVKTLREA